MATGSGMDPDPNLSTPTGSSGHETTDRAARAAHSAVDRAADRTGRAEEQIRDRSERAAESARDMQDRATQRGQEIGDQVLDFVNERPFAALGIAAAAGFVIGNVMKRR